MPARLSWLLLDWNSSLYGFFFSFMGEIFVKNTAFSIDPPPQGGCRLGVKTRDCQMVIPVECG